MIGTNLLGNASSAFIVFEENAVYEIVGKSFLTEKSGILYAGFYQLATMTFTWNASLGSAFGLLEFNRGGLSQGFVLGFGIGISSIALVYNLGALAGFWFVWNLLKKLATALSNLNLPQEMQSVKSMSQIMSGEIGGPIIHLTVIFFTLVTGFWLWALYSVIFWR